jgi:hypothetical protein
MGLIAFLSYSEADEADAHHLYMDFMLHNATPRMLQLAVEDAAQRQKMLQQTIRSSDKVLMLISAASEASALQQEQIEIALLTGKSISAITLDSSALPTWLTNRVADVAVYPMADRGWEEASHHVLTALDVPPQPLNKDVPASDEWVPDKWRVKFFNGGSKAHGYGELELKDDHSVTGTLNIAQGKLTAQTTVNAKWKLEGTQFSIEGEQLVRPMRQPMSYTLVVTISQFGPLTFRAHTAHKDDSVFQRAPK